MRFIEMNGIIPLTPHILTVGTPQATHSTLDYISSTSDVVGVVSAIITIVVMIIGIRTVNRIRAKSEDSIFGFYSRFTPYLELLLDGLGSEDKSVLYHKFTKDMQTNTYKDKTPSVEELGQFKALVGEMLMFFANSDGQIAFSEKFYENRKELTKLLIQLRNLGCSHPWAGDTTELCIELKKHTDLIKAIRDDIELQQRILLTPIWADIANEREKLKKKKLRKERWNKFNIEIGRPKPKEKQVMNSEDDDNA
jgi:hypothetical protein